MRKTQGHHEDLEKSMWEERSVLMGKGTEMKDMRYDVIMTSWARPHVT